MSLSLLKSTTTLAIALSLLQPGVGFAQNAVTVECAPGALGVSVPCLDPQTKELRKPAPRVAGDEAARAAGAEAELAAALETLETARTDAATANLELSLAAAAAADAKPDESAGAAAALELAEVAAEAADQLVADAEDIVGLAETNAEIAALEASEAAELAAELELAGAEAEAEAKAEAEAEAAAEELEVAEVEAAALAAELELAEAEAEAARIRTAEADATATAEANATATVTAEADADADAEAVRLAAKLCDQLAPGVACDVLADDSEAVPDNTPDVPTVAPASEAATATETAPEHAQVVTQTLTEQDTRSSAQEFDNSVSARANSGGGGGLSNLEKAGLLVLGAVVVGAIINNNEKVVANSGDRVVTQDEDGSYRVYKDDNTLLMRPGATVRSQTFSDGSTRSFVLREDGTEIVTIRDADGRVLRRVHVGADGSETMLLDDTRTVDIVDLRNLPRREPAAFNYSETADRDALRQAFLATTRQPVGRSFSLRQIREIREVRDLAVEITLSAITFDTASAAIRPAQAERLQQLGVLMAELIEEDPREMFLIEGYTDAVGDVASNLALSDRRAETVALALAEYFDVPPENLVIQGYGERFLKINTQDAERRNRRVGVRRITGLLH